jgi:hypothetical protein
LIPALTAAHYALVHIGRWQESETVLIYPCGGFIGETAIRVCENLGAPVWATQRGDGHGKTPIKYTRLPGTSTLSHEAISQGHIWRDPTFHGADIVLCTEPVVKHQSWDIFNKFGRVIYMPCITGAPILSPSFRHIPPNISYSAVNIQEIAAAHSKPLKSAVDIRLADIDSRDRESFPAWQVVEAFKHVANSNGQAVVTLKEDEELTLTSEPQAMTKSDPNAAYVICGGTGSIGRGIARWCAPQGARNLILISRSGAKDDRARELLKWLADRGIRVEAPPCDVADEQALRIVLKDCSILMPPTKGCIQASGAFKDISFETMSLYDWNVAIKSTVTASWNLNKTLPAGLDFFIMTSSMSGVHTPQQSNQSI